MFNLGSKSGFTLVEMSIVMIIIGLLIGGVLKGQELIVNSRIDATIAQVRAYTTATYSFRDSYGGWPGDIINATSVVRNCGPATLCKDGNGDGIIGNVNPIANMDVSGDTENTQYWKQLALADLISGVEEGANPTMPAYGTTFPTSKFRGGFQMLDCSQFSAGQYDWRGHFLRMSRYPTGLTNDTLDNLSVSPRIAHAIDTKMDDGFPGSGDVQTYDAGIGPISGCEGPLPYDESFTGDNCTLMFFLRKMI